MAAKDTFSSWASGREASGRDIFPITPHDTNELEYVTRAIGFVVGGDIKVTTAEGRTIILPEGLLVAGMLHPLAVIMVHATGTTATGIHGVI